MPSRPFPTSSEPLKDAWSRRTTFRSHRRPRIFEYCPIHLCTLAQCTPIRHLEDGFLLTAHGEPVRECVLPEERTDYRALGALYLYTAAVYILYSSLYFQFVRHLPAALCCPPVSESISPSKRSLRRASARGRAHKRAETLSPPCLSTAGSTKMSRSVLSDVMCLSVMGDSRSGPGMTKSRGWE